jgi:hypothetical protein
MRKPATILATVTALCVAEILLLFSIAVPASHETFAPRSYQLVALVTGYLLISGLAALFSRLNYGNRKWRRRALVIIAVPAMCFFAFIAILMGEFELIDVFPYEQQENIGLAILAVDAFLAALVLFGMWKKGRRRSIELEAEHWLSERHSGVSHPELLQRHRAIRVALCLPTVSVLLAFLFLPEIWALVSHTVHYGEKRVAGYQLVLPITWVVLASSEDRFVYGVAASGMAREPKRWVADHGIPISGWVFSVDDGRDFAPRPKHESDEILEMRSFLSGNESISCTRYWPKWLGKADSRYAFVDCSGPHGFAAYMEGEARDVSTFYGVLYRIQSVR